MEVNAKLWMQFITAMSLKESRKKYTLCWLEKKGRKGIITIKKSFNHKQYPHETTLSSYVLCVVSEGNVKYTSLPGMASTEVHHILL